MNLNTKKEVMYQIVSEKKRRSESRKNFGDFSDREGVCLGK